MEHIVLEVNAELAEKWRLISASKKSRLVKNIELLINKSLSNSDDDFWSFMDEISAKAKEKGLTEEKLAALLENHA